MDKKPGLLLQQRPGTDSPEPTSGGPGQQQRQLAEEAWHMDLRSSILQQYVQYLTQPPLGFIQVKTRPATPKRG